MDAEDGLSTPGGTSCHESVLHPSCSGCVRLQAKSPVRFGNTLRLYGPKAQSIGSLRVIPIGRNAQVTQLRRPRSPGSPRIFPQQLVLRTGFAPSHKNLATKAERGG